MELHVIQVMMGLVLIGLYAYLLWQVIEIARLEYGGKFTSAGPYWVAAFISLFLAQVLLPVVGLLPGMATEDATPFVVGTMQVVAAAFLVKGAYDYYNIVYTTTAFEVEEHE